MDSVAELGDCPQHNRWFDGHIIILGIQHRTAQTRILEGKAMSHGPIYTDKRSLEVILRWCDRGGEEPEGLCLHEIENICRKQLGLELLSPHCTCPPIPRRWHKDGCPMKSTNECADMESPVYDRPSVPDEVSQPIRDEVKRIMIGDTDCLHGCRSCGEESDV